MVKEYSEHCLFLVIWDRLRDPLIAAYPEQSMWLKHLKATEIIQLLAAYTTHYQIGNVTSAEGFSRLIQLALELRLGRNLCLKGRTFHDLNLRGMDLRGADLREARFVNCDWRGAVYNDQTQFDDAVFESCTITNLSDEELFVWKGGHRGRNLLHQEIGKGVKPPAIESLLTHPQLTPEAFNAKDVNGCTILHTVAWHSNDTKLLSRLLNHPLCTKELFMETINSGQNILDHARPIMFSVLLNHPFCTHEHLMKTNAYGLNPLMTNLIGHQYEPFRILLLSSHCTREVMEQPCEQDPRYQDDRSMYKGETLLSFSIRKQYLNAAKKLVSYPESLAFLAKKNQAGIKNIDVLKSLDHFSESLVIPQIQLMSRLADYASFSHRFFHGKWNHHHVKFVHDLLARDDLTYEVIGEQYALYKESLELQGKEFNHEGALAKIMQLLPEEVKQNLVKNQVGHSVQA